MFIIIIFFLTIIYKLKIYSVKGERNVSCKYILE